MLGNPAAAQAPTTAPKPMGGAGFDLNLPSTSLLPGNAAPNTGLTPNTGVTPGFNVPSRTFVGPAPHTDPKMNTNATPDVIVDTSKKTKLGTTSEPTLGAANESPVTIRSFDKTHRLTRGRKSDTEGYAKSTEQRTFLPKNFEASMDGSTRTTKIDAFTVKQKAVEDKAGEANTYAKATTKNKTPPTKTNTSVKTNSPAWLTSPLD
jgi:hypothetical protein